MNIHFINLISDLNPDTSQSHCHCSGKSNGAAQVKNGQVVVINSEPTGRPACIVSGKNVLLFVNGEYIPHFALVRSHDQIEIFTEDAASERSMELASHNSGLSTMLRVIYSPGVSYQILDTPLMQKITVNAAPSVSIEPERFTEEDILQFLRTNGVLSEVNMEKVKVLARLGGEAVIAQVAYQSRHFQDK